jgi:hypothetical protein
LSSWSKPDVHVLIFSIFGGHVQRYVTLVTYNYANWLEVMLQNNWK